MISQATHMQVFHSQSLHHTASWISILAPQDAAISRYQTCILRCVYPEVSQGTGISGRRWSILGYRRPEVRLWHLETRAPWQHPELRKAYLDRLFEGTCWYLRVRVTWDADPPTSGRYNVPVTTARHTHTGSEAGSVERVGQRGHTLTHVTTHARSPARQRTDGALPPT